MSIPLILSWIIEAVLLVIVVAAPWAFGAVHPPFELWVAYGIAAGLCLWGLRSIVERRIGWSENRSVLIIAGCLYAMFLVATLQRIPLPGALIETVSPKVTKTLNELRPLDREQIAGDEKPLAVDTAWSAGNRLSLNPGGSYQFSLRILALAALFMTVSSLPGSRMLLWRLSIAGAAVGSALALFGLAQYFSSSPKQIYWYFETNGGTFATFINRNHYPFFANLALGLSVGLLLDRFQRSDRGWLAFLTQDTWALWCLAAIAFIITSIVVCVSRGGFVSMIFALAVCLAVRFRGGQTGKTAAMGLVMVSGAALLLTWIGFDLFASRLSTLSESDQMREDGRWHLWRAAGSVIAQFPWTGSGGETFQYWETIVHQGTDWNSAAQLALRADNEFLDIFSEYGIVGASAVLAIAITVLWRGYRLAPYDGLAAGAFMSLSAVIAHSCLDFGLRVPASGVLATIIAALMCSLTREEVRSASREQADSRSQSQSSSRRSPHDDSRRKTRRSSESKADASAQVTSWLAERAASQSALSSNATSSDVASADATASNVASAATAKSETSAPTQPIIGQPVDKATSISKLGMAHVSTVSFAIVCLILAWFLISEKRRAAVGYNLQADGMRALKAGEFQRCLELMARGADVVPEDVRMQIQAARISLMVADSLAASAAAVGSGAQTTSAIATPIDSSDKSTALADNASADIQRVSRIMVIRHCVHARDLCPLAYEPHLWLGLNQDMLSHGGSRLDYLARAHQLHPSESDLAYLLGAELFQMNRYDEAWPLWQKSLTFSSKHLNSILTKAREKLSPDQLLTQILPVDARRLFEAAASAESAGKKEETQLYLTRVLDLLPKLDAANQDSGEELAQPYELVAQVYQRLNEPEKAIGAYEFALRYNPGQVQWRVALAQLLIKQERFDQAARELRTAMVFAPEDATIKSLRDRVSRLQKDPKR